jgi:hypothetical protein
MLLEIEATLLLFLEAHKNVQSFHIYFLMGTHRIWMELMNSDPAEIS